jgi:hypothetical protein
MLSKPSALDSSPIILNCHDELIELAKIVKKRVFALFAEERRSGSIILKLNRLTKSYKDLLLVIQEVRFDLGLDEYKRGMTKEAITAAAMRERRTQEEVMEATKAAIEIFRKHGISLQTNEDMMHEDNLSDK